jgi:lipopolysaccharide export LptBFGC system permease protein LptF
MGIVDDIRLRGASSRISEEVLYAEALREIEDGLRRDGLWAKALAQSNMRQEDAEACYLKLRVQSLRDEIEIAAQQAERGARHKRDDDKQVLVRQAAVDQSARNQERNRPVQSFRDWLNVLVGAIAIIVVLAVAATIFGKLR